MGRTGQNAERIEERFAQLIVEGWNYTDAIQQVKRFKKDVNKDVVYQAGSKMAAKPSVTARIKALLEQCTLETLDSIPKWYERTMRMADDAKATGNYNAASQLQRQLGQAIRAIGGENTVHNNILVAANISDEQLIQQLSKGNEDDAAVLRRLIAPNSFDD